MRTYVYAEKNGNASIILSADSEREADEYLNKIVKNISEWRADGEV